MQKLFLLFLLLLVVSSCSIQKRRHFKGYHIEWSSRKEKVKHSAQNDSIAFSNNSSLEQAPRIEEPEDSLTAIPFDIEEKSITKSDKPNSGAANNENQEPISATEEMEIPQIESSPALSPEPVSTISASIIILISFLLTISPFGYFLLSITALIAMLISIQQFAKFPDRYIWKIVPLLLFIIAFILLMVSISTL